MGEQIVCLDLGTTKFCMAHYNLANEFSLSNISLQSVPSSGFKKGMLENLYSARTNLSDLVDKTSRDLPYFDNRIVVGISGSHLSSKIVSVETKLKKNFVSESALQQLNSEVLQKNTEGKEIIHSFPLRYSINGRSIYQPPLGISSRELKVDFLVFEADNFYLKDITQLCNSCDLEIDHFVCEALASSELILQESQKENGCLVLDIGGGSSDGIIFYNNKPKGIVTINIGGNYVTNDLALGLNLAKIEAEKLKRNISALARNSEAPSILEVMDSNLMLKNIKIKDALAIINARNFELAERINYTIGSIRKFIHAGIFLTGGGSLAPNITEIISAQCQLPCFALSPEITSSPPQSGDAARDYRKYATVLGLVKLELDKAQGFISQSQSRRKNRFLKSLRQIFSDFS